MSRWLVGEATGVLRTTGRPDAAFRRSGRDAYRVQAVKGEVRALRDRRTAPEGWDAPTGTVELADVAAQAGQPRLTGPLWRREPDAADPRGVQLTFADPPADLEGLVLDSTVTGGRLLGVRTFDHRSHPAGGWVARFEAFYAAPLPEPVRPAPPPPVVFPTEQRVAPPAAPPPAPPVARPAPVPAPPRAEPNAPVLPDGCLPGLLENPFTALGGCLAALAALALRIGLGVLAILVGTFVVAGLLWGVLARLLPAAWLDALEPARTAMPPLGGGVVGALVALALWGLLRRRR